MILPFCFIQSLVQCSDEIAFSPKSMVITTLIC